MARYSMCEIQRGPLRVLTVACLALTLAPGTSRYVLIQDALQPGVLEAIRCSRGAVLAVANECGPTVARFRARYCRYQYVSIVQELKLCHNESSWRDDHGLRASFKPRSTLSCRLYMYVLEGKVLGAGLSCGCYINTLSKAMLLLNCRYIQGIFGRYEIETADVWAKGHLSTYFISKIQASLPQTNL